MSLKGSNHFQRQKKKITTEYTLSKDRKMICTSEQHFSSFQSAKTRRISPGLAVKSALYNSIVDSNFQRILHGAACSSTADPPGSRISFSLARLSNNCSPNSNGRVCVGSCGGSIGVSSLRAALCKIVGARRSCSAQRLLPVSHFLFRFMRWSTLHFIGTRGKLGTFWLIT